MIVTFTHLHVHSDNSLFDGYQTIQEIIAKVKSMGQKSCALTDHGTMRGILDFYNECTKENIKPILGCEFYFCLDKNIQEREFTHHLVLIAKNKDGYMNLKRLNKLAYNKDDGHFYYKPRIDAKDLPKYASGVICLSACLASIINTSDGEKWVEYYKKIFGNDFYLEIQPHPIQVQEEYNNKLIEYSQKYEVKLVITTDAHYSSKKDAVWHKYWVGLKRGEYYVTDTNFMYSEEELYKHQNIPKDILKQAIEVTQEIDKKIELFEIAPTGNHFPIYPVNNPKEKIKDICRANWKNKVPKGRYKEYGERFNHEIEILEKCNYLNYMLLTWDMLDWARKENIVLGVGRGSASGSLVGYLLGIHYLDPIKHNLLFERFCNPERITAPDIDNDIMTSRRKDVIDYLERKYGEVVKIITYSRTSDKSALQRAGQALEINPNEIDNITSQIEVIDDVEHVKTDIDKAKLISLAKRFLGRIGAFGTHASAILICPTDVLEFCPVEYQNVSDESLGGAKVWVQVACGDYHVLENFGLLKEDVLGLNTLDVISETLKQIDTKIDIYNLPTNDDNVFKLYRSGNLLGVFQMDSTGMRKLAKEMKVNTFENISSLVALFRPAPIASGLVASYVQGKNGANINYLCKEIKEVLSPTYNVIVYQEQVMELSRKLAGYTMGQADMLRKIIGRKEEDKIVQATKELKESIINRGFSTEIAEYIGNQVQEAGRYIFNKSHATAYGYLSYITAYLKTYYPKEYMCALINSKTQQKDTLIYIDECKRMGIEILPPDLRVGNLKWQTQGNALRIGLTFIRNVGKAIKTVPNESIEEVIANNNKRIVEGLIKAGAVDYLNVNRGELLGNLVNTQTYLNRLNQCNTKIQENTVALNSSQNEKDRKKYARQLNAWLKKKEECQLENNVFNTDYSYSKGEIEVLGFSFDEVPRVKDGVVKKIFVKKDKRGKEMAFITFDSPFGEFKCVCFANKWKVWKKSISEGLKCKFACGKENIMTDFQTI